VFAVTFVSTSLKIRFDHSWRSKSIRLNTFGDVDAGDSDVSLDVTRVFLEELPVNLESVRELFDGVRVLADMDGMDVICGGEEEFEKQQLSGTRKG
jgi:hypothetical protein